MKTWRACIKITTKQNCFSSEILLTLKWSEITMVPRDLDCLISIFWENQFDIYFFGDNLIMDHLTIWREKKHINLLHLIVLEIMRILLAFSYFATYSEIWSPPNFPLQMFSVQKLSIQCTNLQCTVYWFSVYRSLVYSKEIQRNIYTQETVASSQQNSNSISLKKERWKLDKPA